MAMAVVHAHCLAFSVSQCVQTLVGLRVPQLDQKVESQIILHQSNGEKLVVDSLANFVGGIYPCASLLQVRYQFDPTIMLKWQNW